MERRVEPFELLDRNLPWYHRSLVLYVVDPHYRVCSTRNVPQQQNSHWDYWDGRELADGH